MEFTLILPGVQKLEQGLAGMLDDRGAGIVMQPETLQMLTQRCGLAEEDR